MKKIAMWTCSKCGRIFKRKGQQHSCREVPIEKHFEGKGLAKKLFDRLVKEIEKKIGKVKKISIPCCAHLFGNYDFLAALPKKDGLEIRIALGRAVKSPRLISSVPLSKKTFKSCFFVKSKKEINKEFIGWLKESYCLKD